MNNKENNFKEKFKKVLISTAKVISGDYKLDLNKKDKNSSSKNLDFFELDNLENKNDFIRLRAETDSKALKKKFSNKKTYQKNLPNNTSCKVLYDIAERIRFELLGAKILKGISKNLKENYYQKLSFKRKDQLKTKEDVNVAEAFELYMLKNFFDIKLNPLSNKILSFWEKEFNSSFNKHINFLSKNIENQEKYDSKFSKILQEMDIFETENEKSEDEKSEDEQDNNLENNEQKQSKETQEKSKQDENQNGIDGNYDLEKYEMDEQLIDTESENQSSENVIQKTKNNIQDNEYKIFTNEFDEIVKAEALATLDEISKLRKNLDQQLINFQDLVTKLANKLQRQLLAKQNRSWEFDLEEGLLDSSKLTRIIMDPYNSLSFKKEKDLDFKDTVVTLLIDNSGSMRGHWPPNL